MNRSLTNVSRTSPWIEESLNSTGNMHNSVSSLTCPACHREIFPKQEESCLGEIVFHRSCLSMARTRIAKGEVPRLTFVDSVITGLEWHKKESETRAGTATTHM